MDRKENTPLREARRKYEEKNKDKRKAVSGTFSTYMPRNELDEINEYLSKNGITKVELIRVGFETLKKLNNGNV